MAISSITLFSNGTISKTEKCFCGIYGIQNNITKKWYVGESIHVIERIKYYLGTIRSTQGLIKSAFAKYGKNNFTCYKLEECSVDELYEREVYWGTTLNSISPNGYNLKLGGDKKTIVSDETKKTMSESQINKSYRHSEETCKKIGEKLKGNKFAVGNVYSKEHKKNLSEKLMGNTNNKGHFGNQFKKGVVETEETRSKKSIAHTGKSKPWLSTNIEWKRNNSEAQKLAWASRIMTDEERAKRSASAKVRWAKRNQLKETA